MKTETLAFDTVLEPGSQDQAAVAAVRQGDATRYRELVERYERRVYAVAWSRLGDAHLAEEATQEAFIKGYRYLGLLGDGAKFAAWMSTIARRTATRLGLRQRRELDKRARWALEQPVATGPAENAADTASTAETLRQALAELPAVHRECLVLFYLEGKSGTEAAQALGISETALRVRLHRARSALRERMEERLAQSLEQLRPSSSLVPSVMAAVLTGSPAKMGAGAGLLAALGTAFGKVLPFKIAAFFAPAIWVLPGIGFGWWMNVLERRNYRDAEGFRVQLHRKYFRGFLLFMGLVLFVNYTVIHWVAGHFGIDAFLCVVGVFSLIMSGFSARLLWFNPGRFQKCLFWGQLLNGTIMLAVGFGLIPIAAFVGVILVTSALTIWANGWRPMRMDYNLFLRATQGMFADPAAVARAGEPSPGSVRLREFAAFLGNRWLAVNYRWMDEGLMLCLPGVKSVAVARQQSPFFLRWAKCSWIRLDWDGAVRAHCSPGDELALVALGGPNLVPIPELEARVAEVAELAWRAFRRGETAEAERLLGQIPDSEVFIVPTARSRATSRLKYLMIMLIIVFIAESLYSHYLLNRAKHEPPPPPAYAAPVVPPAPAN